MGSGSPPLLGGESNPNDWHFRRIGEDGPLPNPAGHTFPLITHDEDNRWSVIGTGFYITDNGLFVTARHVVDQVRLAGKQIAPLLIVHPRSETGLFGPTEWLLRPIMQCWIGDPSDIALGVAATATHAATSEVLSHWTWTLSWTVPPVGAPVATYAFPGKGRSGDDGCSFIFRADSYAGKLRGAAEFRDAVMMPFPYIEADLQLHGATSGGPLIADGKVVGVNCIGYEGGNEVLPVAFASQIRCLHDAFLEDVIPLGEELARRVTFDELVQTGSIAIDSYYPRDRQKQLSGSVVRLDMPPSAPPPVIGFEIYA